MPAGGSGGTRQNGVSPARESPRRRARLPPQPPPRKTAFAQTTPGNFEKVEAKIQRPAPEERFPFGLGYAPSRRHVVAWSNTPSMVTGDEIVLFEGQPTTRIKHADLRSRFLALNEVALELRRYAEGDSRLGERLLVTENHVGIELKSPRRSSIKLPGVPTSENGVKRQSMDGLHTDVIVPPKARSPQRRRRALPKASPNGGIARRALPTSDSGRTRLGVPSEIAPSPKLPVHSGSEESPSYSQPAEVMGGPSPRMAQKSPKAPCVAPTEPETPEKIVEARDTKGAGEAQTDTTQADTASSGKVPEVLLVILVERERLQHPNGWSHTHMNSEDPPSWQTIHDNKRWSGRLAVIPPNGMMWSAKWSRQVGGDGEGWHYAANFHGAVFTDTHKPHDAVRQRFHVRKAHRADSSPHKRRRAHHGRVEEPPQVQQSSSNETKPDAKAIEAATESGLRFAATLHVAVQQEAGLHGHGHIGPLGRRLVTLRREPGSNFGILKTTKPVEAQDDYPYVSTLADGARAAGLNKNDVILSIDGVTCLGRQLGDIYEQLIKGGDTMTLCVKSKDVFEAEAGAEKIVSTGAPDPDTLRSITLKRNENGNFGFAVSGPVRILGHRGHDLHFISVVNAEAELAGLRVGDRILSVNGERCAGKLLHELVTHLQTAGDAIELHVIHDHASMHSIAMRAWEHETTDSTAITHSLHHTALSQHNLVPNSTLQSQPKDPALGESLPTMVGIAGQSAKVSDTPQPQKNEAPTKPPVDTTTKSVPLHERIHKAFEHDAPIREVSLLKANGSFGIKLIGPGGEHDNDSNNGVFIHTVKRRGTGLLVGDMIIRMSGLDFRKKSVRSAVDALSLFANGDEVELEVQNRLTEGLALEAERLAAVDGWPRTVTFEDSPALKERTEADLGFSVRMFNTDGVPVPFVTRIKPEGAVDVAGEIQVGDTILAVGGVPTAGLEHRDFDALLRASIGEDLILDVKTNPELWQHVAPTCDDHNAISALASKLEPVGTPRRVTLPKGLTESELGFRFDGPVTKLTGDELKDIVFVHKVVPSLAGAEAGLINGDRIRFIGTENTRNLVIREYASLLMAEIAKRDVVLVVQNDIEKFRWRQERLDVREILHLSHFDKEGEHRLVVIRKAAVLTPFVSASADDEEVKGMPELGFTMFCPATKSGGGVWYVRSVKPESLASHYGLRRGHRIVRVNNLSVAAISTLNEFHELVKQDEDKVTLEVVLDETGLAKRWKIKAHDKLQNYVNRQKKHARTVTVQREGGVFPFSLISPAALHGYEYREATYVHHLKERGHAWQVGMRVGDLVVEINGANCLGWTKSEVDSVINRARDTITLVVVHDWEGYATEVLDADHAVDLGEVNTDGVDIETSVVTGEERQVSLHYSMYRNFGFKVLGPRILLGTILHDQHHIVQVNSRAIESGLQIADRLVSIDGIDCHTMTTAELKAKLREAHDAEDEICLVVVRDVEGAVIQYDHDQRLAEDLKGSLEEVDLMVSDGPIEMVWQAPGSVRRVVIGLETPRQPGFAVIAPEVLAQDDPLHDRIHIHKPKKSALAAGILEGDQLLSIDGVSCRDLTYDGILFKLLIEAATGRKVTLEVVEDRAGYTTQKRMFKIAGRQLRKIKENAKIAHDRAKEAPLGEEREIAEREAAKADGIVEAWIAKKIHRAIGDLDVKDLDKESLKIREVILPLDAHTDSFGVSLRGPEVRDGTDVHDRIHVVAVGETATKAGLRVHDRLLYINGAPCKNMVYKDAVRLITHSKNRKEVTFGVIADKEGAEKQQALDHQNIKDVWAATLAEGELVQLRHVVVSPQKDGWYGFSLVGPHATELAHHEGPHPTDGMYVVSTRGDCGLSVGDFLLTIDGEQCMGRTVDDIIEQLSHHRGPVSIEAQRKPIAMWEFVNSQAKLRQDVRLTLGPDGSWGFTLHESEPIVSVITDDETARKLTVSDKIVALSWNDEIGGTERITGVDTLPPSTIHEHLLKAAESGSVVITVMRAKGTHLAIGIPEVTTVPNPAEQHTGQSKEEEIRNAFHIRFPNARSQAQAGMVNGVSREMEERLGMGTTIRPVEITKINGKLGMRLTPNENGLGAIVFDFGSSTASGAQKSGIKVKDEIVEVKGRSCEGLTLQQIQSLLASCKENIVPVKVRATATAEPPVVQQISSAGMGGDICEIRLPRVNGKFGVRFSGSNSATGDAILDSHFVAAITEKAAETSGLKVGDRVLAINGKSCEGMTLDDMTGLLAAQAGSEVTLAVIFDPRGHARHQSPLPPNSPLAVAKNSLDSGIVDFNASQYMSVQANASGHGYYIEEVKMEAERAGLRKNDIIVSINGELCKGLSAADVDSRLRQTTSLEFEVTREAHVKRDDRGSLGIALTRTSTEGPPVVEAVLENADVAGVGLGDFVMSIGSKNCVKLDIDAIGRILESFAQENEVRFTLGKEIRFGAESVASLEGGTG